MRQTGKPRPCASLAIVASLLVLALVSFASPGVRGQSLPPSPTPPPDVGFPGSATLAPGVSVTFANPVPPQSVTPTHLPGQPTQPPDPSGCGLCIHALNVKNQSVDPIVATFDGTRFTITAPQSDVLQLFTRQQSIGAQLGPCASVDRQLSALTCSVVLRPPIPSLSLNVTTTPADTAADQTVQLPSVAGDTVVLAGPVPEPDSATGALPPVPVLVATASVYEQEYDLQSVTLHWDGSTLRLETPLATTARLSDRSGGEIACTPSGSGSNLLSCPLSAPQPAAVDIAVLLPAGWNLIAAPADHVLANLGPLYTLQPGDSDYTAAQPGASLLPTAGYWAYLTTPGVLSTLPIALPYPPAPLSLPAGQPALIGNPYQTPMTVAGATAVYRYDPASGYIPVDSLPPGAGAWVYSSGSVTLVPLTPTSTR